MSFKGSKRLPIGGGQRGGGRPATEPQVKYIWQLFIDLGMSTAAQQSAWLELRGFVRDWDNLNIGEAGKIIGMLKEAKEAKEGKKEEEGEEWELDDDGAREDDDSEWRPGR